MSVRFQDVLTLGLALFAMFFGSGNVIFPPFLGMQTAPNWLPAIFSYLLVDIVIAVFSIIVMAKNDEGLTGITQRIGKVPSRIVSLAIILCIGPLICIPRAAAVSYDLLMVPIFDLPNNGWEQILFSFVFFLVTWLLVVRPTKIVDIVGNVLTPLLLAALALLIVKGIINPPGVEATYALESNPVGVGIVAGYQSMDLFGALSFGTVMISAALLKAYKTPKHRVRVLSYAALLSLVLLFLTSIGMCYLGSTVSLEFSQITSQALLVSRISEKIFSFGPILIGVLASLACLTTAIGLSSGTSVYFEDMLNNVGKNKAKKESKKVYSIMCSVTCVVSFIISNLGLEKIVELASPVLSMLFPVAVVLVILSWFNLHIKSNLVFIFASLFAFIANIFVIIDEYVELVWVDYMFLADMQLGWIIPAAMGIALGLLFGFKRDDRKSLKIYQNAEKYGELDKSNKFIDKINEWRRNEELYG